MNRQFTKKHIQWIVREKCDFSIKKCKLNKNEKPVSPCKVAKIVLYTALEKVWENRYSYTLLMVKYFLQPF